MFRDPGISNSGKCWRTVRPGKAGRQAALRGASGYVDVVVFVVVVVVVGGGGVVVVVVVVVFVAVVVFSC
eukprot:16434905-Heterocapsa_arctica.AAC.1